jgi:hypothetical protein
MFYAFNPRTKHDISASLFMFFGIVFGGLHCMGWNSVFPTEVEGTLWRAASCLITVIPLVFGTFQAESRDSIEFQNNFETLENRDSFWTYRRRPPQVHRSVVSRGILDIPYTTRKIAVVVNVVLAAVQLLVYILARLLLIVQALVLLRKQPASAFHTVDWTRFIPHF